MGNVLRDLKDVVSRIGKYYGLERASGETEAAFLDYAEKKRILANLRRTLIFAMFLIIYMIAVIIVAPFIIKSVTVSMILLLTLSVAMLAAYIGVSVVIYNKAMQSDARNAKKTNLRVQVLYTIFWSMYYLLLTLSEFTFEKWIVGLSLWMPIVVIGLLVPVYSLQEGFVPMTLAVISAYFFFEKSAYDIFELSVVVPVILIVIIVVDVNHVERINAFYQEARIFGESTVSRRRLGNIFEDIYSMAFELDFNKNECQILRNNEAYLPKFDSDIVGLDFFKSTVLETVHPDDLHIATKILDGDYIENEITVEGRNQIYVEIRALDEKDEYVWVSVLISPEKQLEGSTQNDELLLCLIQDIEERKKNENRLKLEAERDPLTQLYNKMTTRSLIEECFEKNPSAQHALIIIDIDNFKTINDTRGHAVGDQILLAFANELSRNFRESDILGRAGGDEFVLLIKNIQSIALVCDKLQQLTSSFKKYGIDNGFPGRLSTSIGVAIFGKDGTTYEELFKRADAALYEAKRNGKDQYKFSITRS